MTSPAPSLHLPDVPVALPPRRALRALRVLLIGVGTPLLLFPPLWAAWVAWMLWGTARLLSTSAALRLGRPQTIEVRDQRVTLVDARQRRRALQPVVSGWLEPWGERTAAVLDLDDGRRVLLGVADEHEGARLLAACGVSHEQQVLRVPLGSRAVLSEQGAVFHLLGPLLLGLMAFGPSLACLTLIQQIARTGHGWQELLLFSGVLVVMMVIGLGLGWMLVPGEARVGRDGVSVRRLWNENFFPFQRVRAVTTTPHGVCLSTEEQEVTLPTATFFSNDPGVREALARRIRDAMMTWASSDGEEHQDLARGQQTLAAWRGSLGRLRGGDYRQAGLDLEALVRTVEAPAVSLEHRVGAVLALSATPLEEPTRRRVHDAIRSSAHEPTRVVLQHALDGDLDDELLAAALAADPHRPAARRA